MMDTDVYPRWWWARSSRPSSGLENARRRSRHPDGRGQAAASTCSTGMPRSRRWRRSLLGQSAAV